MVPNLKLFKTRPNYVKANNRYNIGLTYKQVRLRESIKNLCKWKVPTAYISKKLITTTPRITILKWFKIQINAKTHNVESWNAGI